jgi:hypothetical protein
MSEDVLDKDETTDDTDDKGGEKNSTIIDDIIDDKDDDKGGGEDVDDKSGDDKTDDETDDKDKGEQGYWPDDWREKAARHVAGDDEKAYERELRRLQRFSDPTGVYGMAREMEAKFSQGGLIKIPGEDASDEEKAAFRKAMGVPEETEGYIESLELPEGVVLGDDDKPIAEAFAKISGDADMTTGQYNQIVNWYYQQQEEAAALQDEADDEFKTKSTATLKEEMGGSYKRQVNAIASLVPLAPEGLMDRLLSGRTADGRIVGDDPDMVRFLSSLAMQVNPVASVMDDGNMDGKSIDSELAEIDKYRRENKSAYFKDEKMQARERELIAARDRLQARQ